MVDFSFSTFSEIKSLGQQDYVYKATESMRSRFSQFIVTPEQNRAWQIGFSWIHDVINETSPETDDWICLPEYAAPLVSGRPDFVFVTKSHLIVIEMKTGEINVDTAGAKQVLEYSLSLWGKLKAARTRLVIPVLLSENGKKFNPNFIASGDKQNRPSDVFKLNLRGLKDLLKQIEATESNSKLKLTTVRSELLYSPRPSVIEAANALVAATEDKNVITGLSTEAELNRIARIIQDVALSASTKSERHIVIVAGPPGSGKTLVGLRLAHDPKIQELLPESAGTPLYLTGNGPLVDVLVESLARDEVRRRGISKPIARSNADAKVRLIHGITEKKLGIESNVLIFDEGQRIWTEAHMRRKKGDKSLASEAEEVLSYLDKRSWALVVVLLGEGQEISTGEAGIITWLEAAANRNIKSKSNWKITAPILDSNLTKIFDVETKDSLRLKVARRTDNAADVSTWVEELLNHNFDEANQLRKEFTGYPIYVTRDLEVAKKWIREKVEENGGSSGILASSKAKRLFMYGLDVVDDADRSFRWQNWYLNTSPDLNSSEKLEVAATEYKCQGLELDWVGVCWSWDLVLDSETWVPRKLNSGLGRWSNSSSNSQFQINAYRVLLTRSRRGMIIWVPPGIPKDSTMSAQEMDQVHAALVASGAKEL